MPFHAGRSPLSRMMQNAEARLEQLDDDRSEPALPEDNRGLPMLSLMLVIGAVCATGAFLAVAN